MPKFIFFTGGVKGRFIDACKKGGAICCNNPSSLLLKKLLRFHVSHLGTVRRDLGFVISLPGQFVWDKIFLSGKNLSPDDDIYFLIAEGFNIAYSQNYLAHLRKKFRRSKIIHYLVNPIHNNKNMTWFKLRWKYCKKYYDACITMNHEDAKIYNLLFTDYWPCLLPDKNFQPENSSDVFFVGQAKDRLPKILDVYEKLTNSGLKCDFHIGGGVPEAQQKYSDKISYKHIPYDEVLQRVKNTKCVLEILPFGQNYSSYRPTEALWYHKKLLTTNIEAVNEWFYNPEIVQCFTDPAKINIDFIKSALSPENEQKIFSNMTIGDFNIFADFIIKNVKRNE